MRIAPSVNDAVAKFGDGAEFLIRIDAHAEYPHQFCAQLLEIQARTGADSVVVSMHTIGRTCFQRAAAAAQNSFLGNGGSLHRNASTGRWVDHGHHALMRIAAFRAVGGYDELFIGNEDAELDFRLRASGFRIYLAAVSIMYHSRGSAKALFRQYFNYGLGRAMNVLKHRQVPKVRQMLPLAVAPAICLLLLIPISPLFAVPVLLWGAICICYGLLLAIRTRDACVAGAGAAAIAMHAGWSFGFFQHSFGRPAGVLTNFDKKMRSRPVASVIIPTYNGAAFLADAIESACRQSLSNIEIIVSDDASTDTSPEIVTKLSSRDLKNQAHQKRPKCGSGRGTQQSPDGSQW